MLEQNNEIALPNDSSASFGTLIEWIYDFPDECHLSGSDDDEMIACMEVYLLAERYSVTDVQNALTESFGYAWVLDGIPPVQYAWIIRNLAEKSPLHKLGSDTMAYFLANCPRPYQGEYDEDDDEPYLDDEGDEHYGAGQYSEQLNDLLSMPGVAAKVLWAALNAKGVENPTLAKFRCRYHVHLDGKQCKTEQETDSGTSTD